MSAFPQKLGIVAGGGLLPKTLLEECDRKNIQTFVIAFDGQTDLAILDGRDHKLTRLGAAGGIISTLKDKAIPDLCLIGSIKRPRFTEVRPDLRTAAFFAKIGFRALGDDGLLKAIRAELEDEGFTIHGIHELVDGLLIGEGALTKAVPTTEQMDDIKTGLAASRKIGADDVGQSVVVGNGWVIGTEDEDGTDALIKRAGQKGAILVKSSKPQQDRKLDMPTLGSNTVRLCAELGYAGIAAEAGGVLLADKDAMIAAANEHGLFVVGV